MPFENGVYWKPLAPQERGRHSTFAAAVSSAFSALSVERNSFFDAVANDWAKLFPSIAARPGRYEDGKFFLYVRNAPALFSVRSRLPKIRQSLLSLPGAPKRVDLRLEIHSR